jgi:hypothetical protein
VSRREEDRAQPEGVARIIGFLHLVARGAEAVSGAFAITSVPRPLSSNEFRSMCGALLNARQPCNKADYSSRSTHHLYCAYLDLYWR